VLSTVAHEFGPMNHQARASQNVKYVLNEHPFRSPHTPH